MATAISWNFIVGKKPAAPSSKIVNFLSLQSSNSKFIHSLSTIYYYNALDNL